MSKQQGATVTVKKYNLQCTAKGRTVACMEYFINWTARTTICIIGNKKNTILTIILGSQNTEIEMMPILEFGIGDKDRDPRIQDCKHNIAASLPDVNFL